MQRVNQRMLSLRRGAPISRIASHPRAVADLGSASWFAFSDGWFAITQLEHVSGGTPGLVAFQWVKRLSVLDLLLDGRATYDPTDQEFPEPDAGLLGFQPLTFGAAVAHEKGRGNTPMHTASHRMTDGSFRYSALSAQRRIYHFAALNPQDSDCAIGVQFRLAP